MSPTTACANVANHNDRNTEGHSQLLCRFSRRPYGVNICFTEFFGIPAGMFSRAASFPTMHETSRNRMAHVLKVGNVLQVIRLVVFLVTIPMIYLLTVRTWTNEGERDQFVRATMNVPYGITYGQVKVSVACTPLLEYSPRYSAFSRRGSHDATKVGCSIVGKSWNGLPVFLGR